ncbi:XdhC family protein [Psychrobacter sp. Marseille-P5312]|uniref:XdhC family protein n=1 Tax=Psychrobacter sp. Marseille-P5312 TaxID=2086574 RepID=UPI000CF6E41E|nr:XdhC/CoxI family protein [Psychrobacter sp. Marseille-P5312]
MNQVADILQLAFDARQQHVDAVLATVVRTEGSAYRKPGAMMLICEDGRSVGMISGGCLEPHIIKRAFWLTRHGASVQVYQTGDEQEEDLEDELEEKLDNDAIDFAVDLEDELNFGLGCNGKVHVLFERLSSAMPYLDLIQKVRQSGESTTVATLIRSNSSEVTVGTRVHLNASFLDDNKNSQEIPEQTTNLPKPVIDELSAYKVSKRHADYLVLKSLVANDNSSKNAIQTEWLVQRVQPQIRLLVCGAGNDVMPLVTMAKLQDWHVTVIDSRPQYATRQRFPQADAALYVALDDSETLLKLSQNAAVALMSHSLSQDRARLAVLLKNANHCNYIGQLGPRYRTERLIKEISATCADPTALADGINQLHYPIGYKLGGDGPEALALSIIAQISAVVYEKVAVTKELAQPKASYE